MRTRYGQDEHVVQRGMLVDELSVLWLDAAAQSFVCHGATAVLWIHPHCRQAWRLAQSSTQLLRALIANVSRKVIVQ